MKCKCSLNNNYKIIGLCDIENFTKKINKFKDKSWEHVTLCIKLKIPKNLPSLKNILKCHVNAKIIFIKTINLPLSNITNIEGKNITGKCLLVNGVISQKIVYIADNNSESMHCFNYNIPFSIYIPVNKNINIDEDNYCFYPCIEDVFIYSLDYRTLINKITLFLFAHKSRKNVQKLLNAFIIKNNLNKEIARIEFDIANTDLIVVPSGVKSDLSPKNPIFKFILYTPNGSTKKDEGFINADETGNNLKDTLDGNNFDIGDLIVLEYVNKNNISLSNYPTSGKTYLMEDISKQSFKIKETEIIKNILPQQIILNTQNSTFVFIMEFDSFTKHILINSTDMVPNLNYENNDYFTFTLFYPNGITEKYTSQLSGNKPGTNIFISLNSKEFEYDDILELKYLENNNLYITNYPNKSVIYNPIGISERFRITKEGLKSIINFLPNSFIIKNFPQEIIAKIGFNILNNKFIVISTEKVNDRIDDKLTIFELILYDEDYNEKKKASINGHQSADNLKTALYNQNFDIGNLIIVHYVAKQYIQLSNFPNINENYIMEKATSQGFKITSTGIKQEFLPNIITLNDENNLPIFNLKFDAIAKILWIDTDNTNRKTNPQYENSDYFIITFLKSDGTTKVYTSTLQGNTNASEIIKNFDSKGFEYDGIIELKYIERKNIIIMNYPDQDVSYNPTGIIERFKITKAGLQSTNSFLPNAFIINNFPLEVIAGIGFDILNKKLIAISTGKTNDKIESRDTIFEFILYAANYDQKLEASIKGKESGDDLKVALDNQDFEIGDLIVVSYIAKKYIHLSNFPNIENNYIMEKSNSQGFKITPTGIKQEFLPNIITLNDENNLPVFNLKFDAIAKILWVDTDNSDRKTNPRYENSNYFTITLFKSDQTTQVYTSTLQGNNTGFAIITALDSKGFEYEGFLKLEYKENLKVIITNFPARGNPPYNPLGSEEYFKITPNGLTSK